MKLLILMPVAFSTLQLLISAAVSSPLLDHLLPLMAAMGVEEGSFLLTRSLLQVEVVAAMVVVVPYRLFLGVAAEYHRLLAEQVVLPPLHLLHLLHCHSHIPPTLLNLSASPLTFSYSPSPL